MDNMELTDEQKEELKKLEEEALKQKKLFEDARSEFRKVEGEKRRLIRETKKLENAVKHGKVLLERPPVPSFRCRHPRGISGLQNLGNTCFMNSALQCLAKSPFIRDYFVEGKYVDEINLVNRLGTKGELVRAYADFLQSIFKGEYSHISPRFFKFIIGKVHQQYEDFLQQDCAELLNHIIDGIHEDLNRVLEKPLTSPPEIGDRPDEEIVKEAWEIHRKRNDSIMVDYFQGMHKSSQICPECNYQGRQYQVFFNLSLPVPIPAKLKRISVAPLITGLPLQRYGILANENKDLTCLRQDLAKFFLDDEFLEQKFVIAEVSGGEVKQYRGNNGEPSSVIKNDKLYAFVLDDLVHLDKHLHENYEKLDYLPWAQVVFCGESHSHYGHQSLESLSVLPAVIMHIPGKTTEAEIFLQVDRWLEKYKISDAPPVDSVLFRLKYKSERPSYESDLELHRDSNKKVKGSAYPPKEKYQGEKNAPSQTIICEINHEFFFRVYDEEKMKNEMKYSELPEHQSMKAQIPHEKPATLEDCFEIYTKEENLGQDDLWKCPKCEKKVNASKKTDIYTLPPLLIIQLNRFQYRGYTRHKLTHHIDFPIYNLDLSKFTCNPNNENMYYDLYAVSNHYGTLSSGHYTNFAKTISDDGRELWHKYDDMDVTEIPLEDVQRVINTDAGYILFYCRKDKIEKSPLEGYVFAKFLNRSHSKMRYNPSTTLAGFVKYLIDTNSWNQDYEHTTLVWRGIQLEDFARTFKNSGIRGGETIHVLARKESVVHNMPEKIEYDENST